MSDVHLDPSPPHGVPEPGWYGVAARDPGVLASASQVSLYLLQPAQAGGVSSLAQFAQQVGLAVPRPGCVEISGDRRLAWSGRGAWLYVTPDDHGLLDGLRTASSAGLSITDQSDGRSLLRMGGPAARRVLQKGSAVDLDPRAFGTGRTALTSISHVGVQILQISDMPDYELVTARSSVAHVWHWMVSAAGEFGLRIERGSR